MLREYSGKCGKVSVCIDGIAASAASVVAMAGDIVSIVPTATMMIHDPTTFATGNAEEFKAAIKMLNEIKGSIINAYELKTKLPRYQISEMMTAETWLNAQKAVELGFCDKILYNSETKAENNSGGVIYSPRAAITNCLLNKLKNQKECNQMYQSENYQQKPILANPKEFADTFETARNSYQKFGIDSKDYRRNFFDQVRTGFRDAQNYLREATGTKGGYLVPAEFHDEIITELKGENVLRQISRVVQTANDREIAIQTTAPTASFVAEGAVIPLSTAEFDRKTLKAYKLAAGVSVSNELLEDSFYSLEEHLATEFAKAIAATEENAFLNGTGSGEPIGILPQLAADSTTTITTAGASIAADDIINLVHKLKRPYRKNAVFLMNDTVLAVIRKLKDNTGAFLWQPNLAAGTPATLLGYPVHASEYLPGIISGNIPVLFGDFTRFIIGQRGEMVFKPLHELHALQDLSTFLLIERVDGVLTDAQAIRGLKIQ